MIRLVCFLLFGFLLVGCSYIKKHPIMGDQNTVYKNAQAAPNLKIPASLPNTKIGSDTQQLPQNVEAKPNLKTPFPPQDDA